MHPDIQELQVKLKEILYDCVTDVKATKAALYLFDQPTSRFELVTEYGFKGTIRTSTDKNDPIIDRSERGRTPFFVNGLAAEPRFSELLFQTQSDRLLVAPVYVRGQLVGVVDMRDKAGKQPFEPTDLPKAQRVAERVAELFAGKNAFGQRFITMSGSDPLPAVLTGVYSAAAQMQPAPRASPAPVAPPLAAAPAPAPQTAAAPPPPAQAVSYVPRVSSLILEARAAADRIRDAVPIETVTEAELNIVREILRAVLLIPGAMVSVFTAYGHLGGIQEIAARALLTEEALNLVQSKLTSWLAKRNENFGPARNHVQMPFGSTGPAMTAEAISKVFTAALTAGSVRNIYLTVAFSGNPDRSTHELLAAFHQQLQTAIEQSLARRSATNSRLRIAEKIVEPDFSRFPELRRHCNAVVSRVDAFARFLGLPPTDIETAKVVALVHDAGMRLLDYDRIYRKRDLSPDDLNILREHAVVGAAIIDPLLGPEIARAVLSHHERFDGRGYPNELAGEEIPLMSRLVQICDVYEAMTGAENYQPPQTHEAAMAVIARGGGSQFDPQLAARFEEMMRR